MRREDVRCHAYLHAWDDIPVTKTHPDGPSFWLRCVRCITERHDVVHAFTGELLHRRYIYPPGYLRSKDEPKVSRAEWRLELLGVLDSVRERRRRPS